MISANIDPILSVWPILTTEMDDIHTKNHLQIQILPRFQTMVAALQVRDEQRINSTYWVLKHCEHSNHPKGIM